MYDAVVIGGGIVGAAIAYHLVSDGAKTVLFDRADPGRATEAGAGILSPETNSRDGQAWFDLAIEAVNYYPDLVARLQAEQEGETGYARCGKLTVAVSEDEVEPFTQAQKIILERQRRRGTPAEADLHPVSAAEAQALFPALAPTRGAIYFRHAARVDGRLLAAALLRAAERGGLTIKRAGVEQLLLQSGRVTGVQVDQAAVAAGSVAIAGGAWSNAFGRQLGCQIPVAPQRGQIIHLDLPGTDTSTWPIITAFRGHYLVPWSDSRVVVGATRETGSGFVPQTSAVGVREVLDEALRVAPGLAEGSIGEIRVGLRPLTPDLLPVLGAVPGVENIYLATGHGPTGLQLGPYSGRLIAAMMLGQAVDTDLSPFQVSRF